MTADVVPGRLLPQRPLPSYGYVPGLFPHPVSDPDGHSHGAGPRVPPAADPSRWWESADYLFGVDLFNAGYYWEAHEAWEGLWHACGRGGVAGDFLKGLIQTAAAGVKVRQGVPRGVASLAAGAAGYFRAVLAALGREDARYFGLDVAGLVRFAEGLASQPPPEPTRPAPPVERVLSLVLRPTREGP
jgi:uncharacterized protein